MVDPRSIDRLIDEISAEKGISFKKIMKVLELNALYMQMN